jgi:hypothetical protein
MAIGYGPAVKVVRVFKAKMKAMNKDQLAKG